MIEHDVIHHASLPVWGWEIPVYLFLGGVAAGLMILSALASRRIGPCCRSTVMRWLPFAAPLILSVGMGALFLDLDSKLHVFRFYTAFRITSPMSWGSWILLAIYPAAILWGLSRFDSGAPGVFSGRIARLIAFAKSHERFLERANIALGVALGAYTGVLLATLGARALWSSLLLAPLFLVSGVSTGAAVVMLLPINEKEHELFRRWDIAAIAVELTLLFAFFVNLTADGGERGRMAARLFFGGPYTATFWSIVVIAGLIVPLLLERLEERRLTRVTVLAPALLLIGGLALRWIFVAAGQLT